MPRTTISWTDETVNPVIGCSKVSPACRACYAETLAARLASRFVAGAGRRYVKVLDGKRWNGRAYLDREYMAQQTKGRAIPQRVREPDGSWRPARIFCVSMGDLFHESLSVDEIGEVWRWMAQACEAPDGTTRRGPTWIVVTKRPQRAAEIIPQVAGRWSSRPVVHLLTTIESQEYAAPRLDPLMSLRLGPGGDVSLLGVSAEPLLGPLDLRPWLGRLLWVIGGAESGLGARPMEIAWIVDLLDQCRAAGVAMHVKQLGHRPVLGFGHHVLEHAQREWPGVLPPVVYDVLSGRVTAWLRDPKGGDLSEWPEALRVREWPT